MLYGSPSDAGSPHPARKHRTKSVASILARVKPTFLYSLIGYWLVIFAGVTWKTRRTSQSVTGTASVAHDGPTATHTINRKGRYQNAQFLGFNIYTSPDMSDECEHKGCYLGVDDAHKDIAARVDIIVEAAERAHASPHWSRDANTLKVFMAPEFYFRGPQGAYKVSPDSMKNGFHLGKALENVFSQPRWKDWLIIPGTIVAASRDPKNHSQLDYYNTAPVYQGGTHNKWMVFKNYISGIDFLDANSRDAVLKPSKRRYVTDVPEWMDYHLKVGNKGGYHFVQHSKFEMEGLVIGIEICLDHRMGMLAKEKHHDVQLQLIASAGMSIAAGPVVVVPGSPVFLADGFGRTEVSQNLYGGGAVAVDTASGPMYNTGPVGYSASSTSLRNWIADVMGDLTGVERSDALSAGPADESAADVVRISALGDDWDAQLTGLYVTKHYELLSRAYDTLLEDVRPLYRQQAQRRHRGENLTALADHAKPPAAPATYPTVDVYPPKPIMPLRRD